MEGYWKATRISGEIYGLFKVVKSGSWYKTYRYNSGDWARDDDAYFEFGIDDDYDHISEVEAQKIMKELDCAG